MSLQLGARARPRVRRAPPAPGSDGDDAGFLSSAYGLAPDEWQADVLDDWLGRGRDGRWAAATCGLAVPRQNGKNGVVEVRELFGMVALGERFLHTAHEVKTARKAFLRIASFFEHGRQHPELAALAREIRRTNGQEAVILTNGGSVEFIARSRGSGRGFTVDVLVCDEAQDLTDEELAALLPTISAAPLGNPQMILTGTPPDPDKAQQGEVFRRVRSDGESGRDPRLAWTDFGVADGLMPDVDDRDLWHRVNPALGIRLNVAEIERERGLMSPRTFARERLGWWGEGGTPGTAIPFERWQAGLDPGSRFGDGPVGLGVYATADRSRWFVAGVGQRDDGGLHAELLAVAGTAEEAAERVMALADRRPVPVNLFSGSGAMSLAQPLEAAGYAYEAVTLPKMAAASGTLHDAVLAGTLHHLDDLLLDEAVRSAKARATSRDAWEFVGPAVSPLRAVVLAVHGFGEAVDCETWVEFE